MTTTRHDQIRAEAAAQVESGEYATLEDERDALIDALTGLQSTDDPALVPQHDRMQLRLAEVEFQLRKAARKRRQR